MVCLMSGACKPLIEHKEEKEEGEIGVRSIKDRQLESFVASKTSHVIG